MLVSLNHRAMTRGRHRRPHMMKCGHIYMRALSIYSVTYYVFIVGVIFVGSFDFCIVKRVKVSEEKNRG